jgi:hypothetical protein
MTERMRSGQRRREHLLSVLVGVGIVPCLALAALASDPLSRLLKSDTDRLCFRRDYDAVHLKRHPKQVTQAVLLSFDKGGDVYIMLRQRGEEHYIAASCEWSRKAGYDTSGRLMIKAFKGPEGHDCIVTVSASSAEEGGYVLLDSAADGSALTLHVQSPTTARVGLRGKARAYNFKLGRDDLNFWLTRTDAAACRDMDRALREPRN